MLIPLSGVYSAGGAHLLSVSYLCSLRLDRLNTQAAMADDKLGLWREEDTPAPLLEVCVAQTCL